MSQIAARTMSQKRTFFTLGAAMLATAGLSVFAAADADSDARPSSEALAQPCLACHAGRENSVIPGLFGQPEARLVARMREFRDRRMNSVMHRIARGYRDGDYPGLARYFSRRDRGSR